ncbi:MAG: hypothetical protein N2315_00705 [Thermanaerothrix sp.]|nr:hypothetical protein [Thermanaerothrix sp.]
MTYLTMAVMPFLPADALEHVHIKTCWRDEFYLVLPAESLNPHRRTQVLDEGRSGALRLLRTLLGLNSFAVGESHIVRQIKDCYAASEASCGPVLHRLFQSSFRVSRALRAALHPGRAPSIPYLAASIMKEHPKWPHVSCLVAGMGEMGRETCKVLSYLGASVACTSRSSPPPPGFRSLRWQDLPSGAKCFHGVFLCTSSPKPVLREEHMEGSGAWVVDLGSPPQGKMGRGYRYFGIGEIAQRAQALLADYREELKGLEKAAEDAAAMLWAELTDRFPDLAAQADIIHNR